MDEKLQLKVQAWIDGELDEAEARDIQSLVSRDCQAQSLVAELASTKQAFQDYGRAVTLPESREFYWSKIQREIERLDSAQPVHRQSWWSALRRAIVPMGSVAVVLLVGALVSLQIGAPEPAIAEFDSATSDPRAFTYRDYASGTTLVWLSYPAENEFADSTSTDTLR